MSNKFHFCAVFLWTLLTIDPIYALTCRNDYSGSAGCAGNKTPAGDCETLGYSTSEVENCIHYIYCPFDTSYKRCTNINVCNNRKKQENCTDSEYFISKGKFKDGTICGDCVDCNDENGANNPCKGYYTCSGGGRSPKGDVKCTCGNVKYYEDCEVIESCYADTYVMNKNYLNCYDGYTNNKMSFNTYYPVYNTYASPSTYSEYYLIGEKCTTLKDQKVYIWAECGQNNNCQGKSITYGLKKCAENYGIGEAVICGKDKYFAKCNECYASSKEKYKGFAVSADELEGMLKNGYYLDKTICTEDNVTMYLIGSCKSGLSDSPAFGLQVCEGNQGSGKTVECGGLKYFEKCDETCYVSTSSSSYCTETLSQNLNKEAGYLDYYLIGTKCTKLDGKTKVYQFAHCSTTKKDCNGNQAPAYGMQACEDGDGIGTSVKCGSKKFYKQCGGCDSSFSSSSYTGCQGTTTDLNSLHSGSYIAGEKCTKVDGSKVYLIAQCTVEKDCKGNKGPAYGLKLCPSGYYHTGTVKECGGYIYSSECAVSCKYEQKESDCSSGETFTPYCLDANRVWYGECK